MSEQVEAIISSNVEKNDNNVKYNADNIVKTDNKEKLNWRTPQCGGILVNGTATCTSIDSELNSPGEYICNCLIPPKNTNFIANYLLLQAVLAKAMHLTVDGKAWNSFAFTLFTTGVFKKYAQIQGPTLKSRLDSILTEISKKHGLGDYAVGFEAHPDETAYDTLGIKLILAREKKEAEAKAEKGVTLLLSLIIITLLFLLFI
jgi:hypothetical protein